MNYDYNILTESLQEIGITLSEYQIKQFIKYYELLIEKNKVMNLTAITEYNDVMIKHFVDSLSIIKAFDIDKHIAKEGYIRILDMGTGAGFPGIPLKIAYPDIDITLLDSLQKRIGFLNEVISELELCNEGNIRAIHSRAEDFIKESDIRESFDLVVSRAVANLSVLSEYCLPYTKVGGLFIPYKSEKTEIEIENASHALSVLGGQIENVYSYTLSGTSDNNRTMIVIKKTRSCKDIYPRKAGLPSKKPL